LIFSNRLGFILETSLFLYFYFITDLDEKQ
jgi:hypothetical protein